MRLSKKEITIIKEIIEDIFIEPTVYLFGSRLDESKRGGDIDLFIIAQDSSLEQKIKALARLKRALHKPVDIVLHKDFSREIEKEALKGVII
jgi:predicted nucleotidyltransferase